MSLYEAASIAAVSSGSLPPLSALNSERGSSGRDGCPLSLVEFDETQAASTRDNRAGRGSDLRDAVASYVGHRSHRGIGVP